MRKYISMLLILMMVLSFVACSGAAKESVAMDRNNDENIIVDPTPKNDEQEVILFFVSKMYIETGDEKLNKLISQKRPVKYGDISLKEAVVRELMKGSDNQELSTEIPSSANLINVEVADGTAFVNFARDGLYGGSMQEIFTIMQITRNLNALPNIQRVQFLIDGKKTETLMGHIAISEPFEGSFEIKIDVCK